MNALKRKKEQGIKLGRKAIYSEEIILEIKKLREEGLSLQKISEKLDISIATVARLSK
jgi:hypothetical protein